jgi:hypothetical protein
MIEVFPTPESPMKIMRGAELRPSSSHDIVMAGELFAKMRDSIVYE